MVKKKKTLSNVSQCIFPLLLTFVYICISGAGKKKEKKSRAAEEGRGKRNIIRLHEAYTVETVVVADSNMVQYHGAEAAQRFLLTVMNMVISGTEETHPNIMHLHKLFHSKHLKCRITSNSKISIQTQK